jgi:hypothetical protein
MSRRQLNEVDFESDNIIDERFFFLSGFFSLKNMYTLSHELSKDDVTTSMNWIIILIIKYNFVSIKEAVLIPKRR